MNTTPCPSSYDARMREQTRAWIDRLRSITHDDCLRLERIRVAVIQAAVDGDGDALMVMIEQCKEMCGAWDWNDILRAALRVSRYADATTVLHVALM